jgi:hypothetical protein
MYGVTTTYSNGRTSYKEFETDDLEELNAKFLELDKIYGFENLKVVMELDFSVGVDIFKSVNVPTVTVPVEDTSAVTDNSTDVKDETKDETKDDEKSDSTDDTNDNNVDNTNTEKEGSGTATESGSDGVTDTSESEVAGTEGDA